MSKKTAVLVILAALVLNAAGCSKEPENEIVAISQYSIDVQNQAEADKEAGEKEDGTLNTYRYLGGKSQDSLNAPSVLLSRGKGGKAPAELKRYSWYYNDTGVFGEVAASNVKVSGLPCSIETSYVKNLSNASLQKEINDWIDNTINAFTADKAIPILLEQNVITDEDAKIYIYQSSYCSNGILSISIQTDIYPNITAYAVQTFTADLATGKKLSLGDLFYDNVDYLGCINKSVIDQIRSPGFFEVDFSELKRPFSGIREDHAAFTVNGSSINIYFPFGNSFFGTGAKVSVPIQYSGYVYSDPTREVHFEGSGMVRYRNLIEGTPPSVTPFKSVDTANNVNLSSIRFATGDKAADEEYNAIVISAEASFLSPLTLREAISDFLSPEEQINYRIDVSYLQSVLYGGRLLFLQYQVSSVSQGESYSSLRSICIDTLTRKALSFENLLNSKLEWSKKAAVVSQTYYDPKNIDSADVINIALKADGGISLTLKASQASLISDQKAAKVTIDSSCFDWDTYLTY